MERRGNLCWTAEHQAATDLFQEGRSLFVTGSAGSGKTVLLNRLIRAAGDDGVFRTAMTGLAALNIGGTTLHKFAGCGLARGDADYLRKYMPLNARGRWRDARVLFIDECSMLDAELFEKLDAVARSIRHEPGTLFGGIQLVLVGDFFQLPPVSREGRARMLFESDAFQGIAKIRLQRVFRQRQPELLDLLQAARVGRLEDRHLSLLQKLERPIETPDLVPTQLYALNRMVDAENDRRLHGAECSGPPVSYEALNTGARADVEYLAKNCLASDPVVLRVGAQVIHIVNDQDHRNLVNGSRGVVQGFSDDGYPLVRFRGLPGVKEIRMHTWNYKPNPKRDFVAASRSQIPLKLAWALSIHKSQGMSIDCLEVFLDDCFEAGHAYVALSRCTSLEGLRVHLSPCLSRRIAADPRVLKFDESIDSCKNSVSVPEQDLSRLPTGRFLFVDEAD